MVKSRYVAKRTNNMVLYIRFEFWSFSKVFYNSNQSIVTFLKKRQTIWCYIVIGLNIYISILTFQLSMRWQWQTNNKYGLLHQTDWLRHHSTRCYFSRTELLMIPPFYLFIAFWVIFIDRTSIKLCSLSLMKLVSQRF